MSLYTLNPDKFRAADEQLAQDERKREWPLLHGDGFNIPEEPTEKEARLDQLPTDHGTG